MFAFKIFFMPWNQESTVSCSVGVCFEDERTCKLGNLFWGFVDNVPLSGHLQMILRFYL